MKGCSHPLNEKKKQQKMTFESVERSIMFSHAMLK